FLGVENERDFGTAGDEHDLWRSAGRVGQHVGAASESCGGGVLRSVDEGEFLPRENERDGSFLVLEREAPGFSSLGCIGGADQRHLGNRAQRAQLLDRLVRWTI